MLKEILVIDDNPDIRSLVSNILREQNYEVRTAANYDQAILEINKRLPDLAIIDIKLDKTDSKVIHSNETYDVIDNTNLNNLIVSKTILHEGKETGGHNHKGQEEVYIFTEGSGVMQIDDEKFLVTKGDIVLIPDGAFHKVFNTSNYKANNPLIFVCVFDGGRNH